MSDRKKFIYIVLAFVAAYFIPLEHTRIQGAVFESFAMLQEYARQHVLFCLVPAFFIAGGIAVFVSQASVIKYFGAAANRVLAYGVASVSGSVLAVCSCTILPLFTGIYQRGAGIGPATAFLYSGPAINVLAIILTARVLGLKMGIARGLGAVVLSIVIGILMAAIFRRHEEERLPDIQMAIPEPKRALWQDIIYFGLMVAFLIFATWAPGTVAFWNVVYAVKWSLAIGALVLLALVLWRWFDKDEIKDWVRETYGFALLIMPLLFGGVLVAGFLLGRPGHEALIPSQYVEAVVGASPQAFVHLTGIVPGAAQDSIALLWPLWTNFFAAISGAFMYFATLTEVPILQGLMGAGMGEGPALSLLLAGPAVSLPSMLVINSVLGPKKTATYVVLVICSSTLAGMLYGYIFA
ncbi:MAG TPA: permease [Deltaproteobacteria bacterium]|nr:permease [Deltaproteobacteria bacterium]